MPEINGVLETQLWVADLERSLRFYQEVFGCQQIDGGPDRLIALSIEDRQVLLLAKKGASTQPTELPGGTIPPNDGGGRVASRLLHLTRSAGTLGGVAGKTRY